MNTPKSLNFPEDLGYTARHVWARKDGDTLVIGITDFAQDQLGEILFVDLPDAGASFGADDEFGTVESLKTQWGAGRQAYAREPQLLRRWLDAPYPAHGNARPDDGG